MAKRDKGEWGINDAAGLKGLKKWVLNNWVAFVCDHFDFAGDALFGYARVAATKKFDSGKWTVGSFEDQFEDQFKHALVASPFLNQKIAITGAEWGSLLQHVYAQFDIERDDARGMLNFIAVGRKEFNDINPLKGSTVLGVETTGEKIFVHVVDPATGKVDRVEKTHA